MFGWDHPGEPIGPEPAAAFPEARAEWHAAFAVMARVEGIDVRHLTDGQLLARRRAYEAETSWAPKHVAEELRAARRQEQLSRVKATCHAHEAAANRQDRQDQSALHQHAAGSWAALGRKAALVRDRLGAAAESAVSALTGIRNIKDEIELGFDVDPADVNRLARTALDRHHVPGDDSHVAATVTGNTVVLAGHVRTRAQRDAVVGAAWLGHGVSWPSSTKLRSSADRPISRCRQQRATRQAEYQRLPDDETAKSLATGVAQREAGAEFPPSTRRPAWRRASDRAESLSPHVAGEPNAYGAPPPPRRQRPLAANRGSKFR